MATVFVPLRRITDSPFQTRRHYDPEAVARLADSIEREGMLQAPVGRVVGPLGEPLTHAAVYEGGVDAEEWFRARDAEDAARPHSLGTMRVQLALGHRRARAWRLIWERRLGDQVAEAEGVHGVPVGCMPVDLQPLSDEAVFARGVAENRHREDVSAVEEAEAMHAAGERFGWTHEAIGDRFGYSRSAVSNKLRLLRLPADVRELNVEGLLPERTARALVAMYDLEDELRPFASGTDEYHALAGAEVDIMIADGWSHERVATYVREYLGHVRGAAARAKREREPEMFEAPASGAGATAENVEADADPLAAAISDTDPTARAIATDDPAPFVGVTDDADGYDDGGEQLKAVAEAQGLEPFDAPTSDRGSEAEREGETGEPMEAVAGDTLTVEDENLQLAEWDAVEEALYRLGTTIPDAVRPVLSRLVEMPGGAGEGDAWAHRFAVAGHREMCAGYGPGDARDAAEAWGIAVEWPASGVSAETAHAEDPATEDPDAAPHPDTGAPEAAAAVRAGPRAEGEEKAEPLSPDEEGMLVRMFQLYEDTQANGYRVLGAVGQATADSLHERGLVCAHVGKYGRMANDRVCLTREGTQVAVQLSASVTEPAPEVAPS